MLPSNAQPFPFSETPLTVDAQLFVHKQGRHKLQKGLKMFVGSGVLSTGSWTSELVGWSISSELPDSPFLWNALNFLPLAPMTCSAQAAAEIELEATGLEIEDGIEETVSSQRDSSLSGGVDFRLPVSLSTLSSSL